MFEMLLLYGCNVANFSIFDIKNLSHRNIIHLRFLQILDGFFH